MKLFQKLRYYLTFGAIAKFNYLFKIAKQIDNLLDNIPASERTNPTPSVIMKKIKKDNNWLKLKRKKLEKTLIRIYKIVSSSDSIITKLVGIDRYGDKDPVTERQKISAKFSWPLLCISPRAPGLSRRGVADGEFAIGFLKPDYSYPMEIYQSDPLVPYGISASKLDKIKKMLEETRSRIITLVKDERESELLTDVA